MYTRKPKRRGERREIVRMKLNDFFLLLLHVIIMRWDEREKKMIWSRKNWEEGHGGCMGSWNRKPPRSEKSSVQDAVAMRLRHVPLRNEKDLKSQSIWQNSSIIRCFCYNLSSSSVNIAKKLGLRPAKNEQLKLGDFLLGSSAKKSKCAKIHPS